MEQNVEGILELVKELSEEYTSKESTSVTYETAQQLMGAVLYCIEERESARSEFDMVDAEKSISVREIYKQGYDLVLEKTVRGKEGYNELALWFEDYGNLALRRTFDAIPEFFIHYDARFHPQSPISGLDYPVLLSLENLYGVDRIHAYLECIRAEQIFLQSCPKDFVIDVLLHYSEDYEELICNLGGILIKKLLGNLLLELPADYRRLEEKEYEKLSDLLLGTEREELEQNGYELIEGYAKELITDSDALILYLSAGIADAVAELKNAAENDNLPTLI